MVLVMNHVTKNLSFAIYNGYARIIAAGLYSKYVETLLHAKLTYRKLGSPHSNKIIFGDVGEN
jgi:hypothetical protein